MAERLQKVLAHAGVASRRACEELIVAGRVRVNGQTVTELGTRVDPIKDVIEVDGRRLRTRVEPVYLLLHKPAGYLSTAHDPEGRPTVLDLAPRDTRLYPVGRLDVDSEGLLLLTNDGELANRLTHPRYEQDKEYSVLVAGQPTAETLDRLRQGLWLAEDQAVGHAEASIVAVTEQGTWLRVILHEGRKRQIRRMLTVVGHPVRRLIRVRMGPLTLGDLEPGRWRRLAPGEVRQLKRLKGKG
jgi:23S rRNA pseudouridine2605 synthase